MKLFASFISTITLSASRSCSFAEFSAVEYLGIFVATIALVWSLWHRRPVTSSLTGSGAWSSRERRTKYILRLRENGVSSDCDDQSNQYCISSRHCGGHLLFSNSVCNSQRTYSNDIILQTRSYLRGKLRAKKA